MLFEYADQDSMAVEFSEFFSYFETDEANNTRNSTIMSFIDESGMLRF